MAIIDQTTYYSIRICRSRNYDEVEFELGRVKRIIKKLGFDEPCVIRVANGFYTVDIGRFKDWAEASCMYAEVSKFFKCQLLASSDNVALAPS